jgi:hypothetical protein
MLCLRLSTAQYVDMTPALIAPTTMFNGAARAIRRALPRHADCRLGAVLRSGAPEAQCEALLSSTSCDGWCQEHKMRCLVNGLVGETISAGSAGKSSLHTRCPPHLRRQSSPVTIGFILQTNLETDVDRHNETASQLQSLSAVPIAPPVNREAPALAFFFERR